MNGVGVIVDMGTSLSGYQMGVILMQSRLLLLLLLFHPSQPGHSHFRVDDDLKLVYACGWLCVLECRTQSGNRSREGRRVRGPLAWLTRSHSRRQGYWSISVSDVYRTRFSERQGWGGFTALPCSAWNVRVQGGSSVVLQVFESQGEGQRGGVE